MAPTYIALHLVKYPNFQRLYLYFKTDSNIPIWRCFWRRRGYPPIADIYLPSLLYPTLLSSLAELFTFTPVFSVSRGGRGPPPRGIQSSHRLYGGLSEYTNMMIRKNAFFSPYMKASGGHLSSSFPRVFFRRRFRQKLPVYLICAHPNGIFYASPPSNIQHKNPSGKYLNPSA